MRIIVSDSSCLIDLRKVALLGPFLSLEYEVIIPDTLFEDELLNFSQHEKLALKQAGMNVVELPGEGVRRAQQLESQFPALSLHDCFACALAERHPGCMLLTGDHRLRTVATRQGIEVHGILWVIDEIHRGGISQPQTLLNALEQFEADPTVHLPVKELRTFIKRYRASIK